MSQVRRPPRQVAPGRGTRDGKPGQTPFVPTQQQRFEVCKFVACGFTQESIATITTIPINTLLEHFAYELREGKVLIDAKILGGIVDQALEGDKTMRIFYARARAGWSHSGPGIADGASAFSISIGGNGSDSATEIRVTAIPRGLEPEPPEGMTIEGEAEEG